MDLPPPWELRESMKYPGRCFYFNRETHESSWLRPVPYPGHPVPWPPAIFAFHILIKESEDRTPEQLRQIIEGVRQNLIQKRRTFEKAAQSESEDPNTRAKSGCLGWIRRGQMPPEFDAAAWRLHVGEMSPPVRTSLGWHLILRRG